MQDIREDRHVLSLEGDKARFLWSSTPGNPTRGSVDLEVTARSEEINWIASNLQCKNEGDKIVFPDFEAYNKLLLYSAVRSSIRSRDKAKELAVLILDLKGWDVHYWSSRFRELWWRHRKTRSLGKTAKAFKLFFGLD